MTAVSVNTYTHSLTYLADNLLKSLKDVIVLSELDPGEFVGDWTTNMLAVKTWLGTGDLIAAKLDIYDPKTNGLLIQWSIEIVYSWTGEGTFWTDTEQLRYAIRKAGVAPSQARYELRLKTKPGRPDVPGWGRVAERSTDGLVRQSLGTTIEHYGLGGRTSYLRRA